MTKIERKSRAPPRIAGPHIVVHRYPPDLLSRAGRISQLVQQTELDMSTRQQTASRIVKNSELMLQDARERYDIIASQPESSDETDRIQEIESKNIQELTDQLKKNNLKLERVENSISKFKPCKKSLVNCVVATEGLGITLLSRKGNFLGFGSIPIEDVKDHSTILANIFGISKSQFERGPKDAEFQPLDRETARKMNMLADFEEQQWTWICTEDENAIKTFNTALREKQAPDTLCIKALKKHLVKPAVESSEQI